MATNLTDRYSIEELEVIDIQFLGLIKKDWEFARGARTQRLYMYDENNVAIKDCYDYTMSADGRTVVSYTRTIFWYDLEGNEIMQKDVSPDLSAKKINTLNRDIRYGRIDWLQTAGEQLAAAVPYVPEPYATDFDKASKSLNLLFSYYDKQVRVYEDRGTLDFENAVLNESDAIILEILALQAYLPDAIFPTGLTIKDSIIYQLTGATP